MKALVGLSSQMGHFLWGEFMNDKELAEKVARMLGWELKWWYSEKYRSGMYLMADVERPVYSADFPVGQEDVEDFIFSWEIAGLCIDKARDMGWECRIDHDGVVFGVPYKDPAIYTKFTPTFSTEEHGHIKAIIKAFSEMPEPENG